jgi:hypothetical protein
MPAYKYHAVPEEYSDSTSFTKSSRHGSKRHRPVISDAADIVVQMMGRTNAAAQAAGRSQGTLQGQPVSSGLAATPQAAATAPQVTIQMSSREFRWFGLLHSRPRDGDMAAMHRWMDEVLQVSSDPSTGQPGA